MRYMMVVTLAVWTSAAMATTQFYTFAEWETLAPGIQNSYVAGALDGLLAQNFEPFETALNDRYSQCLLRSRVNTDQLRKGTLAQVTKNPSLRSGSVLTALLGFLNDMCPDLLGIDAIGKLIDTIYLPDLPPAPQKR